MWWCCSVLRGVVVSGVGKDKKLDTEPEQIAAAPVLGNEEGQTKKNEEQRDQRSSW